MTPKISLGDKEELEELKQFLNSKKVSYRVNTLFLSYNNPTHEVYFKNVVDKHMAETKIKGE